jgi:hypothetical protein
VTEELKWMDFCGRASLFEFLSLCFVGKFSLRSILYIEIVLRMKGFVLIRGVVLRKSLEKLKTC